MRIKAGSASAKRLSEYNSESYLADFGAEYDQLAAEVKQKEEASQARPALTRPHVPSSNATQSQWGAETPSAPTTQIPRKDRTKTRPDDVEALAEQIVPALQLDAVDDAAADDDNATIPVSSQSAAIFARMYTRSGDARKGTKWDDLTAAMVDAGLSVEHTRGSAVRFEHATKGSVTLYRPHPHPVLNLIHLRAIRKRCWKWFGWDEGTFVERE
ncbi:hypothetical protein B0A55_02833 [Friedmanniomyces simplex]|uniref:Uncharacterized protein n=1 Tax=Friedmanniomyces simplex TaxID=329884 RepID=A0A4U0XPL8_9PEZI|nr:hypothetical protein B0A55_02833 [Friedmanniomyces simplex]